MNKSSITGMTLFLFGLVLVGSCQSKPSNRQPDAESVKTRALETPLATPPDSHIKNNWRLLDFANGKGRAKMHTEGKAISIEGCLRHDLLAIKTARPNLEASADMFVPAKPSKWASAALTIFGPNDNQRLYAMLIFNNPSITKGMTEIGFYGKSMIQKKLPANTWVRMRVKLTDDKLQMKVWPKAKTEPSGWDVGLPSSTIAWNVAGFGPRTYGGAVMFSDIRGNLEEGKPHAWRKAVPQPIFPQDPSLVDLYWTAWEQASQHVKEQSGLPQSPYMDEACWDDAIWIWDTCFMVLFCKYSPKHFPGVESLQNFYQPMHNGVECSIACHIADNPPLFAWAESENYKFNGNVSHIKKLLTEDKFLQKHYRLFETIKLGFRFPGRSTGSVLRRHELGFHWNGGHSGMDNTPRGRDGENHKFSDTLWVDALAQQGLSALYISRMFKLTGDTQQAEEWKAEYERVKELVNKYYWDDEDGIYYDIDAKTKEFVKVKTPASYWPMLAEMCSKEQAARLVEHLKNPNTFGGKYPWVTLARDDKDFNAETGDYWRGGIWLPTAYMGIKALEVYGYYELAEETSYALVQQMNETYKTYKPATIWECYNPSKPEPSTEHGRRARPDFCGWSALGPISLFIENIIGIHDVNTLTKQIRWRLVRGGKIGLKNLRFGEITTSLIHDGHGVIEVSSSGEYTLFVNSQKFDVKKGSQTFKLDDVPK